MAVVGAGLAAVGAPPAAAETKLTVEAGYNGAFIPGRPVPVRVVVTADRLVKGSLVLQISGFTDGTTTTLPVEVPGGSVKEFLIVIPTPGAQDSLDLTARLEAGGTHTQAEATIQYAADQELVGLLPAVTPAQVPAAQPLAVDLGLAAFAALSEEDLAAGPGSLAALGTIVAGPGELATLDGESRAHLLQWVATGGRLLVDGELGAAVDGVPDAWQPGASGRASAGLGEIRLTAGAAAAERWSTIIEPTPRVSPSEAASINSMFFPPEAIGDAVARDTGVQFARLGWLLGFLAIYVAVAGPVTFFVLGRLGRRDLAWVAVPALAVLFAAGAWLAGSDLRRSVRAAHGTVLVTSPAGASVTTYIGMVSRNGGDGSVDFPAKWVAGSVDTSFFGGVSARTSVVARADQVDSTVVLDAGQFGLVSASGSDQLDGALEVTATAASDDEVEGTVHNTTDLTLHRVGIFVGRSGADIGTIEPGETKHWNLRPDRNTDLFAPAEASVWSSEAGFDRQPAVNTVVELAVLAQARQAGLVIGVPGTAVAVGWTRDYTPPARSSGRAVGDGRTAIISRAPITSTGPTTSALAVRREMLRGTGGGGFKGRDAGPAQTAAFRFVLPTGADPESMYLAVPGYIGGVEVWVDGGWVTVDENDGAIDPNVGINPNVIHRVALPAGAAGGGQLFARVAMRPDVGGVDGSGFELREGTP